LKNRTKLPSPPAAHYCVRNFETKGPAQCFAKNIQKRHSKWELNPVRNAESGALPVFHYAISAVNDLINALIVAGYSTLDGIRD
jgi:hypothetical protein